MAAISMKELLEAGVHFGHQTRRWDPKMDEYIFTSRNGIHIIDLQKTLKMADDAYNWVKAESANGANFLFVGTKKQASEAIKTEAERAGVSYVDNRWLGGTLTNWKTIHSRIDRLKELRVMSEDGTYDKLPKKEVAQLEKQRQKLEKFLGGIADMKGIPDVMFVVDPKVESIAVEEARTLGIPIVAMLDTNSNPELVDVKIPANDDAIRAVKLIVSKMADAIIEGRDGEDADATSAMLDQDQQVTEESVEEDK